MAETVVEAAGLRKSYGDTTALDGLDLEVRRGEVFGIVGPNGAGTETVRTDFWTAGPPAPPYRPMGW